MGSKVEDRLENPQAGDSIDMLAVSLEEGMSPEDIKAAIKTVLEEMEIIDLDVDEYVNDDLINGMIEADDNDFNVMIVKDAEGNLIAAVVDSAGNIEVENGAAFSAKMGPGDDSWDVKAVDYQNSEAGIEIASGTVQVYGEVDADRLAAIAEALGDPEAELNNQAPDQSKFDTTEGPIVVAQVDKLGM